ncbi:MAG: NUDIX domain-containing protein [Clostridium sp.]
MESRLIFWWRASVNRGEAEEDAVAREAREETGLSCIPHEIQPDPIF